MLKRDTYPNIEGIDDDIAVSPLARMAPTHPRYRLHRLPWLYVWAPYAGSPPGDRALLRAVFANLLANTVKFTRPRDTARIEIGGETGDGELVVFVRDNGVGFDPEYAQNLFGVVQRLHRVEDCQDTGVGLANVSRFALSAGRLYMCNVAESEAIGML